MRFTSATLAALAFALASLASNTACAQPSRTTDRRQVGLALHRDFQTNPPRFARDFFPHDPFALESALLQSGEVRLRVVRYFPRLRSPSAAVAAEFSGFVGRDATVVSDHDHNGFTWKKAPLSAAEFNDLLQIVLDEAFLAMPQPTKPVSMGEDLFFCVEVATDKLYGRFSATLPDVDSERRATAPLKRAAAALFRAAGFRDDEIDWDVSAKEQAQVHAARARAAELQRELERLVPVCSVQGPPEHPALAQRLTLSWTSERYLLQREFPAGGFTARVAVRTTASGRIYVHAIEGSPRESIRDALVRVVENANLERSSPEADGEMPPTWFTFKFLRRPPDHPDSP